MIKRFLRFLANLTKKQIIGYCVTTTILFFIAASIFLTGALYLPPNEINPTPSWALPMTITGAVILVLLLFSVLLMALGSNYGSKNKEDQRAEVEKNDDSSHTSNS